ncbi:hypothetical protein CKAH01_12611 [Colletotrichum kahawae]|uniref:Uncharacterized protein n=1 Tax=Colletotrichum kahawae TaxID=34407 RepID=A0AAD9YSF5_COLKA|nr:hypothetical protein CKAH01_12611 [Colletotrichum kahawae]
MVTAKQRDALAKYTVGQNMSLRPFPNPGPPHSMGIFPKPVKTASDGRPFQDYTAQQPSNFNPNEHYEDAQLLKLNIVEAISGGASHDRQILLCKTDKAPRQNPRHADIPVFGNKKQCVVAIVIDTVCYGDSVWADSEFCRRAAVLQHLHRSRTESDTINPEYYGTWVLEAYDSAEKFPGSKRYVGVILREHLEGETIGGLCTREPADRDELGRLIAPPNPVLRVGTDDKVFVLNADHEVRHKITMQLMHGIVTNEHRGVRHTMIYPEDVMVVFRRHGNPLDEPQAVLLGTLLTHVWSTLDDGNGRYKDMLDRQRRYKKPLHPFDRFTHNDFENLDGWYDVDWCDDNRFKLDAWMLRQFGLMDEAENQRRYLTWEDLRQKESDVTGARNSRLKTAFAFIATGGTREFPLCSLPATPLQPPPQPDGMIAPKFGNFRHQEMARYLKTRHDRRHAFWRAFEKVMTDVPQELEGPEIELRAALAWLVASRKLLSETEKINASDKYPEGHDVTLFKDFLGQFARKSLKRKRDESSESDI